MSDATQRPEGVRAWYERTTKKIRKAILWSSLWAIAGSVVFYFMVSEEVTHRLQIFNGAIVIPVAAAIWIAAFIWMFLLPSREAGFRSQEAIERAIALLSDAIDRRVAPAMEAVERVAGKIEAAVDKGAIEKVQGAIERVETAFHSRIVPAGDAWNRLGQRLEGAVVNDRILVQVRAAAESLAGACRKLEASQASAGEVAAFVDEARPLVRALEALRVKAERDLGPGFVQDLKAAVQSARELGSFSVHTAPPPARLTPAPKTAVATAAAMSRELQRALSVIGKKKVSV